MFIHITYNIPLNGDFLRKKERRKRFIFNFDRKIIQITNAKTLEKYQGLGHDTWKVGSESVKV